MSAELELNWSGVAKFLVSSSVFTREQQTFPNN